MTHLEKVRKEIARVNAEIANTSPRLKAAKEMFAQANLSKDSKAIAEAKKELDAIFAIRDKLKADRIALFTEENLHIQMEANAKKETNQQQTV